jgi:hypothetical protein
MSKKLIKIALCCCLVSVSLGSESALEGIERLKENHPKQAVDKGLSEILSDKDKRYDKYARVLRDIYHNQKSKQILSQLLKVQSTATKHQQQVILEAFGRSARDLSIEEYRELESTYSTEPILLETIEWEIRPFLTDNPILFQELTDDLQKWPREETLEAKRFSKRFKKAIEPSSGQQRDFFVSQFILFASQWAKIDPSVVIGAAVHAANLSLNPELQSMLELFLQEGNKLTGKSRDFMQVGSHIKLIAIRSGFNAKEIREWELKQHPLKGNNLSLYKKILDHVSN